jgi:molecular chaperone GrpE
LKVALRSLEAFRQSPQQSEAMSKHRKHDDIHGSSTDASGIEEQSNQTSQAAGTGNTGARSGSPDREESAAMEILDAIKDRDTLIEKLQAEVSTLKDQYLRKLADYENFRKRMFREKDDAVQFANSQLLTDLVSILDDFDRAVSSSETSRDFQSLHDGIDMIRRQLLGLLESKYGLSRFESMGEPFDPNHHEAMMSEQGDCIEPTVVEEYSKGYRLRDRILRSAKVKVRMPVVDAQASFTDDTGAAEAASSN